MMEIASGLIDQDFDENQIDGGVEGLCVKREEEMIVAVLHIAECITFGK